MIRKFNLHNLFVLLLLFTLFNLPVYALAQESTETPVVATDTAPVGDEVIIVTPPGYDSFVNAVTLVVLAVIAAVTTFGVSIPIWLPRALLFAVSITSSKSDDEAAMLWLDKMGYTATPNPDGGYTVHPK